jgi:hypothetical protein
MVLWVLDLISILLFFFAIYECDLVPHLKSFPKQHSNNQLKANYNLNTKVALIQDLIISVFVKEDRYFRTDLINLLFPI